MYFREKKGNDYYHKQYYDNAILNKIISDGYFFITTSFKEFPLS